MKCPTPCVCGEIVELDEMESIAKTLPDGGNLVCDQCYCIDCNGEGRCGACDGIGDCECCGQECPICGGDGDCPKCDGKGYSVKQD